MLDLVRNCEDRFSRDMFEPICTVLIAKTWNSRVGIVIIFSISPYIILSGYPLEISCQCDSNGNPPPMILMKPVNE